MPFSRDIIPVSIIGISGASRSVIDPMITRGMLPNIRSFIQDGTYGVLESVKVPGDRHYRPQTAWPSVMTGLRPERHGITRFFHTRRDLKAPAIWDHFSARGCRIGLYGLPMTWPVFESDGFLVPSPWARDDSTWPKELSYIRRFYRHFQVNKSGSGAAAGIGLYIRQLPSFLRYGQNIRRLSRIISLAFRARTERDPAARATLLRDAKLEYSAAMFTDLYRRYRPCLSVFVSFEIDYISHRTWRYHQPELFGDTSDAPSPGKADAIERAYRNMDRCIGEIAGLLPSGGITAILSEHGMAPETVPRETGEFQYLIRGDAVRELAGLGSNIMAVPLARWIAFRRADGGAVGEDTRDMLDRITVEETGLPLFSTRIHSDDEVVLKLDLDREVYSGFSSGLEGLHVRFGRNRVVLFGEILKKAGPSRSAMHDRSGIFILKGPGIRAGNEINGAGITDIMPTLLHASGFQVPSGLDGTVLDIFSNERR